MKKIIYTVLLVIFLLPVAIAANSTEAFIQGLQQDLLFTRFNRTVELSGSISVAPFNAFDRWMSPDAIAVYNGTLNMIKIDENDLVKSGRSYAIKDARVIRGNQFSIGKVTTIFHELGHAELDIFIENKVHPIDQKVMGYYERTMKPFYQRNFSGNPHTIFHEHFSYYRTDLIEFMYEQQNQILLNNGFNKYKNSCFLSLQLKKRLKDGISLEEFKKFQTSEKSDESYAEKVGPRFVFVRGKDYDLAKPANSKEILNGVHQLFWEYHQVHYGFPANEKEYVAKMNLRSSFREQLASCREELWNSVEH